jgi:hypothetical protein
MGSKVEIHHTTHTVELPNIIIDKATILNCLILLFLITTPTKSENRPLSMPEFPEPTTIPQYWA